MIIFSNCKINLGLRVLRKRADGYHDLETVFYPVPFNDVIEVIRAREAPISFTTSGLGLDLPPEQNLCMKAYTLLRQTVDLPPMQLHLHKTVPSGAGLGGGSADAAFTLKLLNNKFNLGLTTERLLDLALQLGSDCPFFIINKPCFAAGRGELFEPVDLSQLKNYKLAVVTPGIHVSTAWAFGRLTPRIGGPSVKDVIAQPVKLWRQALVNDFEDVVFEEYPAIRDIRDSMYSQGALYTAMSGSGSAVYGVFDKDVDVNLDGVRIFDLAGD
jgi:4-diphosphocytidyl-2-C-methyl-D-erythritol kinase